MKIIVGLGNPGKKYAETRHNVGFMVVNAFADRHKVGSWRRRFHALAAETRIGTEKVILMKPETYVNESGRAVREAMAWCRTSLQDVIIVCDDFNLPLGRLRFRSSGRSGGHNGLESVIAALNTNEVPRLRLGIGTEEREADKDFVLSTFSPQEQEVLSETVERGARALEMWLAQGMERCQNEFNPRPGSEESKEEAQA